MWHKPSDTYHHEKWDNGMRIIKGNLFMIKENEQPQMLYLLVIICFLNFLTRTLLNYPITIYVIHLDNNEIKAVYYEKIIVG